MMKQRRGVLAALAAVVIGSGLAASSARSSSAQDRPNIDAIVRQFHVNYSNNNFEKNGALVDNSLVVHLNGGADTAVNGATFGGREAFVAWLKRDKVMFSDGKITDHGVIVSGNMAAIRFTLEGTHTGRYQCPTAFWRQPAARFA